MDEIDLENNPAKHYRDIAKAVKFVRERVKSFDDIPPIIVPTFLISKEDIQYLEDCVRETVSTNDKIAGVDMGDGYEAFLEYNVRFGLNCMLKNENDPQMEWYFMKRDKKINMIKPVFVEPL